MGSPLGPGFGIGGLRLKAQGTFGGSSKNTPTDECRDLSS